MELILKRVAKRKEYTIGRLYKETAPLPSSPEGEEMPKTPENSEVSPRGDLEGAGYLCDTLEPTWRDYKNGGRKIPGRSAIPEGRYLVLISWSPKFKQWLPLLWNVPKFTGVRIHAGNTVEDTEGCILVGKNQHVGSLVDSRIWVHRLKQEITNAHERGEKVYITIK